MSYKKLGQQGQGKVMIFTNPGDRFEGTLLAIREHVHTKIDNDATVADLQELDSGEQYALFLSTGLKNQLTPELVGERILIEYEGEKKNKNSGRMFKAFSVSVWSDDDTGEDGIEE